MRALQGSNPCRGINLVGLIETMSKSRRPPVRPENTHRIGRPRCLENPRPKGGMLTNRKRRTPHPPAEPEHRHPVAATEHWRCGPHWPAEMAPSPTATNTQSPLSTYAVRMLAFLGAPGGSNTALTMIAGAGNFPSGPLPVRSALLD